MTVLPSPIPHPLEALPWDVPGWAYECLEWVIGIEWPAGDERAVWDLADAWFAAGSGLAGTRSEAVVAAQTVTAGYAGPASDAFAEAWQAFDADALGALPAGFAELGSLVSSCAAEIEAAKIEVWIEVGLLVIELLALVVAMALSAGAATPAATAAAGATRVAIQRIFGRLVVKLAQQADATLLQRITRRALVAGSAEAAQEVGADAGTQSYQVLSDHRSGFDFRSLGMSAVGGFAGGVAGSAIVPGLSSGVVSHSVRSAASDVLAETAASLATGQGIPGLDDAARSATSGGVDGFLDRGHSNAAGHHHGGGWAAVAAAAGALGHGSGRPGDVPTGASSEPVAAAGYGAGLEGADSPRGGAVVDAPTERVEGGDNPGRSDGASPGRLEGLDSAGRRDPQHGDAGVGGASRASPERVEGSESPVRADSLHGDAAVGASPRRVDGGDGHLRVLGASTDGTGGRDGLGRADVAPGREVAEPTAAHFRPAPLTAPTVADPTGGVGVAPSGIEPVGREGAPRHPAADAMRLSDVAAASVVGGHAPLAVATPVVGETRGPRPGGGRSPVASEMLHDPTPEELRSVGVGRATYADLGLDPSALSAAERARYDRVLPLVAMLPLGQLRFTQRSVSPTTRDGTRLDDLAAQLHDNGWRGGPIDCVRWADGSYATLDNRRPRSAGEAGLERVPSLIHTPSERLSDWPDEWPPDRIARNALTDQIRELPDGTWKVGGDEGTIRYDRGTLPQTFAEAALFRAAHQRSLLPVDLFGTTATPVVMKLPDQVVRSPSTEHLEELEAARRTIEVVADAVQADIEDAARAVSADLEFGHRLELKGLTHRLKTLDSLARKYADEGRANQMSVAEFLADTKDVLRFSLLMPDGDAYAATVGSVLAQLENRGYRIGRTKNYWRQANRFYGLNVELTSPDDQKFEIQFPTNLSWRAGRLTHDLYSVVRHDGSTGVIEPPVRRVHAFLRMLVINKEVGVDASAPAGSDVLAPAHDASFSKWVRQKPEVWVEYQAWLAANGMTFAQVVAEFELDGRDLADSDGTA
ncbi:hypothetical protein DFJ67_1014 [Asanoa ferruginea]|uniref:Outer membrane channel protein CpnT-like N-terminal domain-containing protein n=1 Tax=Asanoa ferruginea TaxID=53367 RepID=A0A3D9ZCS1_9ACTN|nr:hypothetical protein [Asanoa ferruginea]REF95065.1 hypothetical protein DFJ67_1014 [Asanoa ferruginea]GIF48880.1 hypothetical protein Afe04nite_34190 [Asanoa ferruginea]